MLISAGTTYVSERLGQSPAIPAGGEVDLPSHEGELPPAPGPTNIGIDLIPTAFLYIASTESPRRSEQVRYPASHMSLSAQHPPNRPECEEQSLPEIWGVGP